MENNLAIDLRHVAKNYGRINALRGIEMQVHPGEIFGLLGPNGAGKSTLVKIMMTVIRPSHAEGTVLGRPIGHKPTLARVGYLPENHHFPPYLTGREALEFYGAMSSVDRPTRRRRAAELLQTVGLSERAKSRVRTYSKGMQQRLGLAQALMNDPQLVVLDEPTDGLDPIGRREVRDVLKSLRDQGRTVFINSHLLSEVESICDRVAILSAGKVVRQGTIEDLTASSVYYEIQVLSTTVGVSQDKIHSALECELAPIVMAVAVTEPSPGAAAGKPAAKYRLRSGPIIELDGNTVRVLAGHPGEIQCAIDALRRNQLIIQSVRLVRQSLEDYFIAAVTDNANSPGAAAAKKGGPS
jgi:ABC-2 type transport system ATP-binding protein